jgi:hypothetical protein
MNDSLKTKIFFCLRGSCLTGVLSIFKQPCTQTSANRHWIILKNHTDFFIHMPPSCTGGGHIAEINLRNFTIFSYFKILTVHIPPNFVSVWGFNYKFLLMRHEWRIIFKRLNFLNPLLWFFVYFRWMEYFISRILVIYFIWNTWACIFSATIFCRSFSQRWINRFRKFQKIVIWKVSIRDGTKRFWRIGYPIYRKEPV